ncbi:hypothetical protein PVK06_013181 [Gossypium arboreum]|uniref:Uncharacterized protein n=1 Tax=Gossypium arboreum TaxID=29729 RepID=A0ABR0QDH5_GOSAR|nr:hypothetical protein PVK06_013181 [Gossypium arboreum]
MEVIINEVVLEARHVQRWKFHDRSRTLPSNCFNGYGRRESMVARGLNAA